MVAIIKNIAAITGTGIFDDYKASEATPPFLRLNLIYGFNGSGKTTLARVLASAEIGNRHPRLPSESTFQIHLDDGVLLETPESLGGIERRVLVFSSDFVEQNFQWNVGTAKPVFYIGAEQAEIGRQISECEGSLPSFKARMEAAESAKASADKEFAGFKRERARTIATMLALRGRAYEANHLAADYDDTRYEDSTQLEPEIAESWTAFLNLDAPLPKVARVAAPLEAIREVVFLARDAARESPAAFMLDEMRQHPTMVTWLKEGADYHAEHALDQCLLCGNKLHEERKAQLAEGLDSRLGEFINSIDDQITNLANVIALAHQEEANLPQSGLLIKDVQGAYGSEIANLKSQLDAGRRFLEKARSLLEDKRSKLSTLIDPEDVVSESEFTEWEASTKETIIRVNGLIDIHNDTHDQFSERRREAQEALKGHCLSESREDYRRLKNACEVAAGKAIEASAAFQAARAELRRLREKINEHGHAAEKINHLIEIYLGHNELAIAPVEDGYEIHRHGRAIEGLPSEGEKTALALCYFIATLEAEGRVAKDLIVIIDDPISSLDTKALNFACGMIRSRLEGVAQLIVLTHNQQCMNEFKKAWRSKAEGKDGKPPTASFMFLDVYAPAGQNKRASRIVKMSKLLREYESEYHYLFHHVLAFARSQGEYEYAYMMPNALRKVLDIFLAFKCPGSSGLTSKIEQIAAGNFGLDIDRIAALERLAQAESHANNLDDLIGFSSMTLEETRDAAEALLTLIEKVDKTHFQKICRLCR